MNNTPKTRRRAASSREESAELGSWVKGLRFSGFSIIMIGLLVLGAFIISPSLSIYLNQRQEIAALEISVQQKQEALDNANAEKERWQDPAYVRAEARNRLFYMMPGENQLVIIDDVEIPAAQAAPASANLQQTETNWARALGYSIISAGITQGDAASLAPEGSKPTEGGIVDDQTPTETPADETGE
ncbi:septum formation initiator family protein [Lysinibacter sp. HNR]|uniref:FtsB family cell division protein n=1 Tax=Lysinibacter sp. HNR TaxID=3031408 RepID=UPI002434E89F|nr:septum formation initiator family protein [Lysinibacter sp. HNR]WGD38237.1 septum formation initiator family protein [Lysinibacter sp. HNR]